MSEHNVMHELYDLLTSGRTQAAVTLIEAEMRVARSTERAASAHLAVLRDAFDGPDAVLHSTVTEMAEWVMRMKAIDEPEFMGELFDLLTYGYDRAREEEDIRLCERYERLHLTLAPQQEDDVPN